LLYAVCCFRDAAGTFDPVLAGKKLPSLHGAIPFNSCIDVREAFRPGSDAMADDRVAAEQRDDGVTQVGEIRINVRQPFFPEISYEHWPPLVFCVVVNDVDKMIERNGSVVFALVRPILIQMKAAEIGELNDRHNVPSRPQFGAQRRVTNTW